VGFLDDLKRQAEAVRERQDHDGARLQQRAAATQHACRTALAYFNLLADQLEVLRPVSPARFVLDRKHVFQHLPMSDFFADGRLMRLGDLEVHEQLLLHWQLKTGRSLHLVKDFPNEIEQLQARLHQGAVPMEVEAVRHPDTGKLIEMRHAVTADFRGSVRCLPVHGEARLQFVLSNLDALETVTCWLPAEAVDEARLDELARWIVGQPHRFLEGVQDLRRLAP
jgi:hypothetical protein